MRSIIIITFFIFICLVPIIALKSNDVLICAKFRENYEWSKGYEVNALIAKGDEMNRSYKTHDYHVYSSYAIIYLNDQDPYIIELDSTYFLGDGATGEDQHGRRWKIYKSNICL